MAGSTAMTAGAPSLPATLAREVGLVLFRELGRSLRSVKGIILSVITFIGGVVPTLLLLYIEARVTRAAGSQTTRGGGQAALELAYGKEVAESLSGAPAVTILMFTWTLGFAALLAAAVGYDAIASELQHRGIRYSTVRARRDSFVIGKWLGTFTIASMMTFVIHAISWILVTVQSDTPASVTLSFGPKLWLLTLPISLAWCALVTFVSSLVRTPILGLFASVLALIVTSSCYAIGVGFEKYAVLSWIHPGGYDRLLLSPDPMVFLQGLAASFGFSAVFIAAGIFVTTKRDV